MTSKRFDRIADIAGTDDWQHDPFGTSMGFFFDVAAVLDASDIAGDVSPAPFERWGYGPGMATVPSIDTLAGRQEDYSEGEWSDDYPYGTIALAGAYRAGEVTQADLIYVGDVLSRYTDALRRAGKDY